MKKTGRLLLPTFLFGALLALAGCAGDQQGYRQAFDAQHSLTQNQASFSHPAEPIFKIVKQTFTQQGFTIESADLKSGIVKAVRNMADKDDSDISYNIHVSTDISEVAGADTNVAMAASQQTVLHRSTTTWWHLLWILPIIPTGTEYQTLVIKEGNITDPVFYTDFFNSLKVAVTKYDVAVKAAAAKAAEKAEAERVAAEKAARIKAEAEAKAAAERAEAEKVAAEKAARIKAEAEAKAASERAEAERVAAENAAKVKAEAEAKAASEKAEAERSAADKTAKLQVETPPLAAGTAAVDSLAAGKLTTVAK
jgi:flagellar biosynthesis GTPase FlhF